MWGQGGYMADDVFAGLTVMVVDDQRSMRMILRQLLGQIGVRDVIDARDGAEAIELLRARGASAPDVVICDLYMDNMDGFEFANLVRRNKVSALAGVPILILTGEADAFMHEVAEQVGATKVLTKPISAPELREEIAEAIGYAG